MKRLSQVRSEVRKQDAQIINLQGINLTDNYQNGDLASSRHIGDDHFPHISSWVPRVSVGGPDDTYSGITSWDDLIYIKNRRMYVNDEEIDYEFADGDKQFTMMQNKLIVWPDKVYVNMTTHEVTQMAARIQGYTAEFEAHTLQITTYPASDLTEIFRPFDAVQISGLEGDFEPNNGWWVIDEVSAESITFKMAEEQQFVTGNPVPRPIVERVVPDLAFITVQNNRLWGVDNEEQAIWSSVQGDPCNFYTNRGIASDSAALPVSSGGSFTGIATLGSQVLAFKEDVVYKVLGLFPDEYQYYDYHLDGVAEGCGKSMVKVNDAIYYMSRHGMRVYYGGGGASEIGQSLGTTMVSGAVCGSDGERLYLSGRLAGKPHLYVMNLRTGIWYEEDDTIAKDFARVGDTVYMLREDGKLFKERGGSPDGADDWGVEFKPFLENTTGSSNKNMVSYGLKRYHRMIIRADIPLGSYIDVYASYDRGPFEKIARLQTHRGLTSYPVPIRRSDLFTLKLEGKGPADIWQIQREFSIGAWR